MRARRAVRIAVATVVASVLLASHASADWARLTRSGFGWPPCTTVVLRPDTTAQPSHLDLVDALRWATTLVNDAVGRVVVAVGTPPTSAAGPTDVTVRYQTGTSSHAAVLEGGSGEIQAAEIVVGSGVGTQPRLRAAVVHEIGHTLGLDHVPDARDVMSYGWIDRGDGIGPGSTEALRHLYTAPCDARPAIGDSPIDWPWNDAGTSYRPRTRVAVATLAESADDVQDVAVELARTHAVRHRPSRAVVCRDDLFADCLGGAALAGDDGVLLFVPGGPWGRLPDDVAATIAELERLSGTPDVFVLGGPQAVSEAIEDELDQRWPTIRLAGEDRFATAAVVAARVAARAGDAARVLVARADDGIDAVTAGAWAAAHDVPILLAHTTHAPPATLDALRTLSPAHAVLLGGDAALSPRVAEDVRSAGADVFRVAGRTRTETSSAVAVALWGLGSLPAGTQTFYVTNGWDPSSWALVLAAAPLAAADRAPILLGARDSLPYTPSSWPFPGDPGWYLLTVPAAPDTAAVFVGVGGPRWADAARLANTAAGSYAGFDPA